MVRMQETRNAQNFSQANMMEEDWLKITVFYM
jgi:hypothetical protein